MKILIVTQYFPPEIGAPQNRLYELAYRLVKKGVKVNVLTAMPNYPKSEIMEEYRNKIYLQENMDEIVVHRSWIYVSKKRTIIRRLLNYFSFVITSFITGLLKIGKQDYVFCESPPLFLGISAYLLSKFTGAKFIFNVSDLWPESAEKLGIIKNKTLLRLSQKLEEFLYRKADLVSGQTQGIVNNVSGRIRNKRVYWLKNGVDITFYNPNTIKSNFREENNFSEDDFLVLYAGIIGHAQGLETILHAANQVKDNVKIKFIIVGTGPEKEKLLEISNNLQLKNVYFFDPVPKERMPGIIKSIDVSLIPLKKLNLFKGAIPSKIFESLALAKPVLLGVDGEARALFIDEAKAGVYFEPENFLDLAQKIKMLIDSGDMRKQLGINGREYVSRNFNRDTIAENFYRILSEPKK